MKERKTKTGIFRRSKRANAKPNDGEMRIYISPIMLIMAAYFVFMGMAYEFTCSLAAVLLHECAHARVAKKFGYELNVIKLMPYGAALCGSVDMRPKHEALIAAAGPLVNLAIATLFAALWWLVPSGYLFTYAFCTGNLYIGLFNLLPVYPLDGGRVLLALLSQKQGATRAYKTVRIASAVVGVVIIGLFIASAFYALNLCLLSVGLFVIVSAFIPDSRAKYRALYSLPERAKRLSAPTEVRYFAVSETAALSDAVKSLDPDVYTEFKVLDSDMREIGTIGETAVINAAKSHGYEQTIGYILREINDFMR